MGKRWRKGVGGLYGEKARNVPACRKRSRSEFCPRNYLRTHDERLWGDCRIFCSAGGVYFFSISAPSRGSGKPPCKQRYAPTWLWGLDAPTTARTVGLPPRRGEYFLSKRKKVPKKACGTALREKGFYCPFWRRGSQCRAQ